MLFIKIGDGWIRTRVLWYGMQSVCQLCNSRLLPKDKPYLWSENS